MARHDDAPIDDVSLQHRCAICQCYLDHEDLFCANCGTENPNATSTTHLAALTQVTFDCQSCGASMAYDPNVLDLRCPYCGSQAGRREGQARFVQPSFMVWCTIDQASATSIFQTWLGRGFWRPSNLRQAARLGKIAQVYVPYWAFEANTHSRWTADSSPAPSGSRGDWHPVSGQRAARHEGILVGGSNVLTHTETASIGPFDLTAAQPWQLQQTANEVVEQFQVPRQKARPLARQIIQRQAQQGCQRQVPGQPRNVRANVEITSMIGQPILLPVWILAYQYKSSTHRVLINGQSGKIAGSAPFSYARLVLVLAIVAAVLLLLLGIATNS